MRLTWKNGTALAAAGIFVSMGAALAQQGSDAQGNNPSVGTHSMSGMKSADMKFAREAALGGMEEVELGKLATQKGQNDKVKQFGQRMIDDHTKAGDQLKSIAAKDNVTLPTELDARHKAVVDRFSNMSGAEFDRMYMQNMVKDHEKDVADFQKEADGGSNSDLKNFAGATLPTLQDHLRMARETNSTLTAMK